MRLFLCSLACLGACATQATPVVEAIPVAQEAAKPLAQAVEPTEPVEPDSMWRNAAFRRQFMLSYSAESEVEPRLSTTEKKLLQKVMDLLAAEKGAEAKQALVAACQGNASAVFDFTLGNLHFQESQVEPALLAYRAAVDKYPKFRRAWRNLALIYVRRAEYVPASEAFVRLLELGGGDSTSYGMLGYCHANLGSHLAAESAYRMACLLDAKVVDWQLGLARSLFEQKRFGEVVVLAAKLLKDEPGRGDFWQLQGNAYLGLNDRKSAAECWEMLDRLGHATPESLNALGDLYVNDELYDLAVGAYLRGFKAGQPSPDRALRAARVLIASGAYPEVQQLLAAVDTNFGARLQDPEKKELLFLRSRLALAEGSDAAAATVLEQIVAMDPLDGEALLLLGQQCQRAGNPEKAIFYYERAGGMEAFEADAKVRHAQLLVAQAKFKEALPLLKRAQAIKPRENVAEYLEHVQRLATR